MLDYLLVAIAVPTVTAFIGWITNWAAVKMIFHPERFVGVGKLGWQGVLPRNAAQFAQGVAETMTQKLLSTRELAERLDPDEVLALFEETVNQQIVDIVKESTELIRPGTWDDLSEQMRTMIVSQVRKESVALGKELFEKMQGMSSELLDMSKLVVTMLSGGNTSRLVRLFQEIGGKELRFIEYYGGVFGFVIGLGQLAAWNYFQIWWLMPIIGVLVGLITNYLAIQMIFRPYEPTRYLGVFRYQGLFPKRQAEIASDYGRIAAQEVLTPRNLIRLVTEGEAGSRIALMVTETISQKIDSEWKKVESMIPVEVSENQLGAVKGVVVARLVDAMPEIRPEIEDYIYRKLDIAGTLRNKMSSMSKFDFERILRGLFEKDEIILIVIGGVLGGCVGLIQAAIVLGGS